MTGDERRVLVATRNAGKLRELVPLLASRGWSAIGLDEAEVEERRDAEDALEVYATFRENALAKARYFFRRSGLPALAEDSGLAVDALGGAPGVQSKRWGHDPSLTGAALDEANNRRLLDALAGAATRAARFVCAAAWVDADRELVAEGEVWGRILESPAGRGGFGYDPVFWSDELGAPFGVVSSAEKSRVSHRARAIDELLKKVG